MTDKPDSMHDEDLRTQEGSGSPQSASTAIAVETDDYSEDGDEMGSDEFRSDNEEAQGELTPNDIFGLDPLDVLTLEELAEYLKIPEGAVRKAVKEQDLPGRNIGGEWRFLRDAVANWLRGQQAPVQQQQKAREEFSKPPEKREERFTRPPQRPQQDEPASGGEYRPRQRFGEGGTGYGGYQGGQQQGGGGQGGQYGNRGGQSYGGGAGGGGQYGGGSGGGGGGNYGGGNEGGNYSRPPRRPFRAEEGTGQGNYGGGAAAGGYRSGGAGGGYSGGSGGAGPGAGGGGGYAAGGQRFAAGPKRKNKRQVFDNERGKRLDRRKEEGTEGVE